MLKAQLDELEAILPNYRKYLFRELLDPLVIVFNDDDWIVEQAGRLGALSTLRATPLYNNWIMHPYGPTSTGLVLYFERFTKNPLGRNGYLLTVVNSQTDYLWTRK